MSDTLGSLIDKLFTADMKMWNNQEEIYKIRHMTFEQFREHYKSEAGLFEFWKSLKVVCDLNVQRNELIDEIDKKLLEMFKDYDDGVDLDAGKHVQQKYKTY
jgi:hypothetical protein